MSVGVAERPVSSAADAAALRHCRNITRSRARNFYYGLKLLPEPRRSAMYALYAWMRAVDDLVDGGAHAKDSGAGSNPQLLARLEEFRAHTARALCGDPPPGDPIWCGLSFAAGRFNLSEEPFHAMIAGQIDDLSGRRYRTFEELREYCYRVASTVGLLCIEIWGYSDDAAKNLAIDRGIAFQLTNILRDFREDFDCGRVYLPEEDFVAQGLVPQELREWSVPEKCAAFITAQIERASSFYKSSSDLDALIEAECRPTLWAMTEIYRRLLRKIRANPRSIVSRRVRLNVVSKTMIALRARTGMLSGA